MNKPETRWLVLFSVIIAFLFVGTFALITSGALAAWWD